MDIRCLVAVGAVIVQGLIVDDVGEVEDMVVGVHEESQKRRLRKRTAQGFSWTRTASRPRSTSRRAATTATLFYSSLSALCCHHLVCPRNHCLTRLTLSLAVAARFGIGKDFWINVLLTLCGYIPGMLFPCSFCSRLSTANRPWAQLLCTGRCRSLIASPVANAIDS